MKRVVVTICFDTDATDDAIHEIAYDMLVQAETLEEELDFKVAWKDLIETKITELKEES